MKFQQIVFLILLALCAGVQAQDRRAALAEVAAAENSFADRASAAGTKTAFVEYAAADGLVFGLKPENARAVWQKRPASESLLSWRPNWVDVSAAGDLGYSTGSWSLSPSKTAAPTGWGEFFSIWKKQPDGSWRFLLDLGIGHGRAEVVRDNWKSPEISRKAKPEKNSAEVWKNLEGAFMTSVEKRGAKKTYESLASAQIRLLREGHLPFQGKESALSAINEMFLRNKVLGGGSSADLAYAYGEYESSGAGGNAAKGFYIRVWKLEAKGWRIAAEVVYLIPPPKS